jgi:Zn-dependent protease with chaperone function
VVLGQLSYSRTFESEADAFAVALLRAEKSSARPLSLFFACLQERPEHQFAEGIPGFMSSHPPTEERLDQLRALDGDATLRCPSSAKPRVPYGGR